MPAWACSARCLSASTQGKGYGGTRPISTVVLGCAVLAVIGLNALFAFMQERQAERAVEALRAYLPQQATVVRDDFLRAVRLAQVVADASAHIVRFAITPDGGGAIDITAAADVGDHAAHRKAEQRVMKVIKKHK